MTWRRFIVLVAGLSQASTWAWWCRHQANRPLEDEAAERYFATI